MRSLLLALVLAVAAVEESTGAPSVVRVNFKSCSG